MKVALTIRENMTYQDEIVIEFPNNMDKKQLEDILKKVEWKCKEDSAKDVGYLLEEKYGAKISSQSDNFPGRPKSSELEITNVKYWQFADSVDFNLR